MSPFDYIKLINDGKQSEVDSAYPAFVINMNYSMFADTIMQANFVNCNPQMSPRMHYDYLLGTIRPRKRFKKWPKKHANDTEENILAVMYFYKYNRSRAKETIAVLTEQQLDAIKQETYHEV
jgi:hypothetical protein